MILSENGQNVLLSDTFSTKSDKWAPLALKSGEYSVLWQLIHRGRIADVCESSLKIGVRVTAGIRIEEPRIYNYLLTPNGDGKNDFFVIEDLGDFPRNELFVYNQWGSLVYKKSNYDNSWDGKSNSSRTIQRGLLPMGTYFYVLLSDGKKVHSGYVELFY